jgi:hypothetical protein
MRTYSEKIHNRYQSFLNNTKIMKYPPAYPGLGLVDITTKYHYFQYIQDRTKYKTEELINKILMENFPNHLYCPQARYTTKKLLVSYRKWRRIRKYVFGWKEKS